MSNAANKIGAALKLIAINAFVLWVLLNMVGYGVAKHHFSVLKHRYEKGVIAERVFLDKVFRASVTSIRPLPQYVGVYDTLTYYWNAPGSYNLAVFDADYTVHHNVHGLRVHRNKLPKTKKPAVAVLGDSHAYGIGVEDEETYAGRLVENGFPLSLVACSSFGTAREVLKTTALCRAGIIDTPEVLVVHYCPNDLPENLSFVRNDFTLKKKSAASYHKNFTRDIYDVTFAEVYDKLPVYMSLPLMARGISNKITALFSRSTFTYFTHPQPYSTSPAAQSVTPEDAFTEVMAYMLRDSLFHNVQQLIVLNAMSPAYHSRSEIKSEESLLSSSVAVLQQRFPAVSMSTLFIPEDMQAQLYFTMDDHTNVEGHAWYAEALKQRIQNHTKQ